VRISHANLQASAAQFRDAIDISPQDRAITTVPTSYIYGLSFLHSYMQAGASLVISSSSIMEKNFWQTFRSHETTTFPGVPWTFQMFERLGMKQADMPSLRTLTVSGGKTDPKVMAYLGAAFPKARMFNMYGQTEACGRISVLHHDQDQNRKDCVGTVVGRGQVTCDPDGAVVYRGPNVMLGYANGAKDLESGDTQNGMLNTGDLGHLDEVGRLYITGRISRFCKVLSLRINLDDIQEYFGERRLEVLALESPPGNIALHYTAGNPADMEAHVTGLAQHLAIPKSMITFKQVTELGRTATGKLRYAQVVP
jgi:long-subunit acyl-CoA synthetase (AMP-forming)